MKEEILDDGIHAEGENYAYLKAIEHYNPILTKLTVALGAYLIIDALSLVRKVLLRGNTVFYYNAFSLIFQLIIDVLLIAFTYRIWQQKKRQEAAYKRDFATNEAQFLEDHYKRYYLLGLVFVAIITRTLLFILFY